MPKREPTDARVKSLCVQLKDRIQIKSDTPEAIKAHIPQLKIFLNSVSLSDQQLVLQTLFLAVLKRGLNMLGIFREVFHDYKLETDEAQDADFLRTMVDDLLEAAQHKNVTQSREYFNAFALLMRTTNVIVPAKVGSSKLDSIKDLPVTTDDAKRLAYALLKCLGVSIQDKDMPVNLVKAAKTGDRFVIHMIFQATAISFDDALNALKVAVDENKVDVVRIILRYILKYYDSQRDTLLQVFNDLLKQVAKNNNVEMMKRLCRKFSHLKTEFTLSEEGIHNALQEALENGSKEVVSLLLKHYTSVLSEVELNEAYIKSASDKKLYALAIVLINSPGGAKLSKETLYQALMKIITEGRQNFGFLEHGQYIAAVKGFCEHGQVERISLQDLENAIKAAENHDATVAALLKDYKIKRLAAVRAGYSGEFSVLRDGNKGNVAINGGDVIPDARLKM